VALKKTGFGVFEVDLWLNRIVGEIKEGKKLGTADEQTVM